jgi:polyhydroxyalkanoate synthase
MSSGSKGTLYTSVYDLDEPSVAECIQKLITSGTRLFAEYYMIYYGAYSKLKNIYNFYKVYDQWLEITEKEFGEHLRSEQFISILNEYVENCADLHAAMNRMGYPVLMINDFIDQYLRASMTFSNIPVRPYETPHEIARKKDDTRLLRYHSSPKYKTPLLIVYAPINRYHIMDLNADKSIVKNFVSGGFDTFLLDWGEQKNNELTIVDYVSYIDESVEEIKKLTGSNKVTLFGYCWGGVLSVIYAALHNEKLKNLIVQAAPVDFDKDTSILAEWARRFPIDKFVDEFKEMDGHILDLAFLLRSPVRYGFDKYVKFAKKMDDLQFVDNFIRVERWLYDTPDIPGEFFRQFIKDLYKRNLLIQNKMHLNGKIINLKAVTIPLLNIVGVNDDLAPLSASIPLNDGVSSSDKTLLEFPVGHVGLCASSSAHTKLWPQVVKWLQERSA